jgi:hypothetical protein
MSKDRIKNYLKGKFSEIYILIIVLYSVVIMLFLISAILSLFIPIFSSSPNYEDIIQHGERGAIFLIAMTGLAFAYAAALDTSLDAREKKSDIINSGENFLKSTLSFVISMIVLMGYKKYLINPPTGLGFLPAGLLIISYIIEFLLCFIGGLVMGGGSVYYFVKGIILLLRPMRLLRPLKDIEVDAR